MAVVARSSLKHPLNGLSAGGCLRVGLRNEAEILFGYCAEVIMFLQLYQFWNKLATANFRAL